MQFLNAHSSCHHLRASPSYINAAMPGVYGGDDISAIVLDAGSSSTRAGWAGEDTPRAHIPTQYGWLPAVEEQGGDGADVSMTDVAAENGLTNGGADADERPTSSRAVSEWESQKLKAESRRRFVGDAGVNIWRKDIQIGSPVEDGVVSSPASLLAVARYALNDVLGCNTSEHPLLLTEPSWNAKEAREELTQLAFEGLDVPAFYLANSTVLSSFSAGKPTSLVVDVGASNASAVPVVDGFILRKGIQRQPGLGGDCISRALLYDLSVQAPQHSHRQGGLVDIVPQFLVKSKAPSVAGAKPLAKLWQDRLDSTSASFKRFHTMRVLHEAKESLAQIMAEPWNESQAAAFASRSFEFPDGYNDNFGIERFRAPEVLFTPSIYAGLPDVLPQGSTSHRSIVDLIMAAIEATDVDSRSALLQNIVCVGGATLTQGFNDRMSYELGLRLPGQKLKIHSPGNVVERKFSSWLGGSILASLGTFHQLWISKQEYEEHGANIVHTRCR